MNILDKIDYYSRIGTESAKKKKRELRFQLILALKSIWSGSLERDFPEYETYFGFSKKELTEISLVNRYRIVDEIKFLGFFTDSRGFLEVNKKLWNKILEFYRSGTLELFFPNYKEFTGMSKEEIGEYANK